MRAITCQQRDRSGTETEQRQPIRRPKRKKAKKKMCSLLYTRCLCYFYYYTTLINVESSFGSSQRVVTRGSILLLYIFLPRFSPFAFASSSSSSPLGRVLSVSAVALGSV